MKENELKKRKIENDNISVIIYKESRDGVLQSAAYVDVTKTNIEKYYSSRGFIPLVTFEYDDFVRYIKGEDSRTNAEKVTMEDVTLLVSKHFFL